MAGAPPCSQYPSHCWSHPGDPGTLALRHPSRSLQEGGARPDPGPVAATSATPVGARPSPGASLRDRCVWVRVANSQAREKVQLLTDAEWLVSRPRGVE